MNHAALLAIAKRKCALSPGKWQLSMASSRPSRRGHQTMGTLSIACRCPRDAGGPCRSLQPTGCPEVARGPLLGGFSQRGQLANRKTGCWFRLASVAAGAGTRVDSVARCDPAAREFFHEHPGGLPGIERVFSPSAGTRALGRCKGQCGAVCKGIWKSRGCFMAQRRRREPCRFTRAAGLLTPSARWPIPGRGTG